MVQVRLCSWHLRLYSPGTGGPPFCRDVSVTTVLPSSFHSCLQTRCPHNEATQDVFPGGWATSGFVNLGPTDILDPVILWGTVLCIGRMVSSIQALYPLGARSTPSQVMTIKCLQRLPHVPRVENHWVSLCFGDVSGLLPQVSWSDSFSKIFCPVPPCSVSGLG